MQPIGLNCSLYLVIDALEFFTGMDQLIAIFFVFDYVFPLNASVTSVLGNCAMIFLTVQTS